VRAFRRDERLGAASPLLLFPDTRRVQHLGIAFSVTMSVQHLYFLFPEGHPAVGRIRRLQALTGAALILPRRLFSHCGGFFSGYLNGFEDMDLCCRVREQGLRLSTVPDSRVLHLTSQTQGRYDRDAENTALFNRRCTGCFRPDLDQQARQDGLATTLTPWLDQVLCLPRERLETLEREHPEPDHEACGEWLHREPLWERPYGVLSRHLADHGRHGEAAAVRELQAYFFPCTATYRALLDTASAAGRERLARDTAMALARVESLLADREGLRRRAQGLHQWARRVGDAGLESQLREWLEDNPA
jgi:hypothetical protein